MKTYQYTRRNTLEEAEPTSVQAEEAHVNHNGDLLFVRNRPDGPGQVIVKAVAAGLWDTVEEADVN